MSWTILSVAYPLAPVSEDAVGGAEQVLSMLDRALVASGRRSIVIAPDGSRVQGELRALPGISGTIDNAARTRIHALTRSAIADVLSTETVNLVHLHGIDFPDYLPASGVPVLGTLHLPLSWYPDDVFRLSRPDTFLHCVSEAQQQTAPEEARLLPFIPNGVDLERFRPRHHKREFALTLGRICPEKGIHLAQRACRTAGFPLLIGGQVYPYESHQTYFREEVEPLLDVSCRFLGPLELARKSRLLAAARCVLIPSLAPETSSLVAMEALASGTPVIAFRSGALSGLLHDGETGFLVNDEREMAGAMGRLGSIDALCCRRAAEARFDMRATIRSYLETYRRVIGRD